MVILPIRSSFAISIMLIFTSEIEGKYSKKSYKDIAKKCLQYSEEWATMCMGKGVTFDNADYFDRYTLKDQCYNFVYDNAVEDAEKKYGSIILTWIFLYVILPTIIRWIINRFLDKLFDIKIQHGVSTCRSNH